MLAHEVGVPHLIQCVANGARGGSQGEIAARKLAMTLWVNAPDIAALDDGCRAGLCALLSALGTEAGRKQAGDLLTVGGGLHLP